jgi:hypothetical protein
MKGTLRFLRILIQISLVLFLVASAGIYVALVSAPVQRALVHRANRLLFDRLDATLEMEQVRFGLFPPAIKVTNATLGRNTTTALCATRTCNARLSVATLQAEFDLSQTYTTLKPVINLVEISNGKLHLDWNDAGELILPVRIPEGETGQKPPESPMALFRRIRTLLPETTKIGNILVSIADPTAGDVTKSRFVSGRFSLDELTVTRSKESVKDLVVVKTSAGELFLKSDRETQSQREPLRRTVDRLSVAALLDEEATLQFQKLELDAPWGKLAGKGRATLGQTFAEIKTNLKFLGRVDLGPALELFDVPATGSAEFNLALRTPPKASSPLLAGTVSWPRGTTIEGMSLHRGKAEISILSNIISVPSLVLNLGAEGVVNGSGEVSINEKSVKVKATGKAKSVAFLDLIRGLDVDTNAVDFRVDSESLAVAVEAGVEQKTLALSVEGPVAVRDLKVTSLHSATRTPLPHCQGSLKLAATFDQLTLTNTSLHCRPDGSDLVTVKTGKVDLNSGKVLFQFEGKNVDLASTEYFLMDNPAFHKARPTKGSFDLWGELEAASSSAPITFSSKVSARDVRLYGVDYGELTGEWGLDSERVWGKSLVGKIGPSNQSRLRLNSFEVRLDEAVNSAFDGSVEGQISDLFFALKTLIPEDPSNYPQGEIKEATIRVGGPLSPATRRGPEAYENQALRAYLTDDQLETLGAVLNWTSNVRLNIQNPSWKQSRAGHLRLALNCQTGSCEKSRLVVEDIRGQDASKSHLHNGLFLDVSQFSLDQVQLAARFQNLPISEQLPKEWGGSPIVNGRCEMQGQWESLRAFAEATIDALSVSGKRFEPIQILLMTNKKMPLEFKISAQSNQIQGRFLIPKKRGATTTGYLNLRNADLSPLLPAAVLAEYQAGLKISGDIQLSGKLIPETPVLNSVPQPAKPWFHSWNALGRISSADASFKQISLGLNAPAEFQLNGDTLALQGLRLQNRSEKSDLLLLLDLSGTYNLTTNAVRAAANLNLNLAALPIVFEPFGESRGLLAAQVEVSGNAPNVSLKGEGRVKSGTVLLDAVPPAFREIDLTFRFNDKAVEIESLRAKKGEGVIEASGGLNWEKVANKSDTWPSLAFDFNLSRVQSRIPVPAVQAVDVELDGRLQLCRRQQCEDRTNAVTLANTPSDPLLIAGNLVAQDARVSRGLDCVAVFDALLDSSGSENGDSSNSMTDKIAMDLELQAPQSLAIDTRCARTRMSVDRLAISGPLSNPRIIGKIETADSAGSGQLGNIRFNIENGSLEFDGRADNPRYDILLSSTVPGYRVDRQRIDYKIFIHLDDRPQNKRRKQPEIRAEPPTHPDGQRPLSQTDLVAMLLTGRGPDASSPVGFSTEFVANEFATLGTNAIFSETRLQSSVSRMFNRLSAGIVDRVAIDPIFEAGRPKFRIRTIMAPVENVNINMETDQDPSGTENKARNAALTSQWILNNGINLGLDLRAREAPVGTNPFSMGGGVTFQFGGE